MPPWVNVTLTVTLQASAQLTTFMMMVMTRR